MVTMLRLAQFLSIITVSDAFTAGPHHPLSDVRPRNRISSTTYQVSPKIIHASQPRSSSSIFSKSSLRVTKSSSAVAESKPSETSKTIKPTNTNNKKKATRSPIPDFSGSTKPLDESDIFDQNGDASGSGSSKKWQENLEVLLSPDTTVAERQIVLSQLLNSSEDIQESVRAALRERKIDGLLTPTGKRIQDGTRAVARQLTSDILPGIAAVASGSKTPKSPVEVFAQDLPTIVPKIGSRILDALSNQAQKSFQEFRSDPLRFPEKIREQTAEIAEEAKNVFREIPEGLSGPPYRVVAKKDGYEIREYEGYTVASTEMSKVDEPYSMDDLASGGAAFNALAAYLFGANEEKEVMEMTTPVTTTSTGEMRFYLREREGKKGEGVDSFPEPVAENDEIFNEKGLVKIREIPPATLAVARFTGFVTEGEVARQKDALLTALAIDGIEIDVPHASVVPHVIFQYNPPYTLPILRRNEIGIPVRLTSEEEDESANLSEEWDVDTREG